MTTATRLLLILTLLLMPAAPAQGAVPARRVVLLSLDGGGEQMMERMLAEGHMPHLQRLIKEGVAADYAQSHFTTKTAAGHAALWTGTWGHRNGIGANRVPRRPVAAHDRLAGMSGFDSTALEAEPLYVSAARAGKRVAAMNLSQTLPLSTFEPAGRFGQGVGDCLFVFSGFGSTPVEEGAWTHERGVQPAEGWRNLPAGARPPLESRYAVGRETLFALLIDDPADPVDGYDTCLLTNSQDAQSPLARLKPSAPGGPAAWSPFVTVRNGAGLWGMYLRLFELSPDGRRFLLYHTAPADPRSSRPEWMPAFYQAGGGHTEGGAASAYARGWLGETAVEGGDGAAEARLLDTTRFALDRCRRTTAYFMAEHPWDLFMHYLPLPDEIGHLWQGYLTPGTPGYDPALAERLWPAMRQVYREVDAYLGELRRLAPDAAIVVVSDHGMGAAHWDFYPNVALRRAGLLAVDATGKIDLARTRAFYSPNDGAYVVVNRAGRPGGVVPPEAVDGVMAEVRQALGGIQVKNPTGRVPLVTAMLEPTPALSESLGLGGPSGGDLYLDLQPGYSLHAGAAGDTLFQQRPTNASGAHMFDSRRPDMHAVFYASGPGFKRGAAIPAVRNIDVAPTIAHLLGIPAPTDATGRVLTEALAP